MIIIIIHIYIALFFEILQSAVIHTFSIIQILFFINNRYYVYPKIVLPHIFQIMRIMNKTPLQSTVTTVSEHIVGPRNARLLSYKNFGLNSKRSFQCTKHWPIGTDKNINNIRWTNIWDAKYDSVIYLK